MTISNNPPYAIIELDEEEYKYLCALVHRANQCAEANRLAVCSMSSNDPRSSDRATLLLAATADIVMTDHLYNEKLKKANI